MSKRKFSLTFQQITLFNNILDKVVKDTRILESQNHIQHGTTSVFEHCLSVAYFSLKFSRLFNWKVSEEEMIRGALLHDYFLYDWHDKQARSNPHGYLHPGIALKNASEVYELTKKEKDIIKHHMFPLTICPPLCKEGFLVSISDKVCSLYETFKMNEWNNGKNARKRRIYN